METAKYFSASHYRDIKRGHDDLINKGFISTLVEDGKKAIVIPQEAGETVTFPLVIPFFLLECLETNMPVVYATFDDQTGIVLARLDGEWNHKIYETLTVEGVTHITDTLTADKAVTAGGILDVDGRSITINGNIALHGSMTASVDVEAGDISLVNHTHGGVQDGPSDTQKPK